jgi:hypothetical protein
MPSSLKLLKMVPHGFELFRERPFQSVNSPVTLSRWQEQYDFVGLPGYILRTARYIPLGGAELFSCSRG